MAHFARIDRNNIVKSIHVVDDEHLINEDEEEEEDFGIAYLNKIYGVGFTWVQSSKDGSFRKNQAGKGYTYDRERDAFIAAKTSYLDSWVLNENTCQWEAPVAYPNDGKVYGWNENTQTWDEQE
jgi:hypothetical protein